MGIFKVGFKTFFNPSGWLGYDGLKTVSKALYSNTKDLITPAKPTRKETFSQAMARMQVKEADLPTFHTRFLRRAYLYVALTILSLIYGAYTLVAGQFLSFIFTLMMAALFLSFAFRNHFYAFQIKHRKLGCTYQEWRTGRTHEEEQK